MRPESIHRKPKEGTIPFPVDRFGWKRVVENLDQLKPLILREVSTLDLIEIRQKREMGNMSEEEKPYAFAGQLLDQGLVGEDLSIWRGLHALYKVVLKRDLPAGFSEKIRLEVFLSALRDLKRGNKKTIDVYYSIGRRVDFDWFQRSLGVEESLLAELFGMSKNPESGQVELSVLLVGQNGKHSREPAGINDDGEIVFHRPLTSRLNTVKAPEVTNGNGLQMPHGKRISHGGRHPTGRK